MESNWRNTGKKNRVPDTLAVVSPGVLYQFGQKPQTFANSSPVQLWIENCSTTCLGWWLNKPPTRTGLKLQDSKTPCKDTGTPVNTHGWILNSYMACQRAKVLNACAQVKPSKILSWFQASHIIVPSGFNLFHHISQGLPISPPGAAFLSLANQIPERLLTDGNTPAAKLELAAPRAPSDQMILQLSQHQFLGESAGIRRQPARHAISWHSTLTYFDCFHPGDTTVIQRLGSTICLMMAEHGWANFGRVERNPKVPKAPLYGATLWDPGRNERSGIWSKPEHLEPASRLSRPWGFNRNLFGIFMSQKSPRNVWLPNAKRWHWHERIGMISARWHWSHANRDLTYATAVLLRQPPLV